MKKILLLVFIILDLVLIAACAAFLAAHFKLPRPSFPHGGMPLPPIMKTTISSTDSVKPIMGNPAPSTSAVTASTPPASTTHKILFSYRNSRAKVVMIRADFTGWKAVPMQKGTDNKWTITEPLETGEYAYVFSVDNRSIRDPVNKHVKQVGKTYVSSVVVKQTAPTSH